MGVHLNVDVAKAVSASITVFGVCAKSFWTFFRSLGQNSGFGPVATLQGDLWEEVPVERVCKGAGGLEAVWPVVAWGPSPRCAENVLAGSTCRGRPVAPPVTGRPGK